MTSLTRAAARLVHPAVVGQVGADRDDPALLREVAGDRRVGHRAPVGQCAGDPTDPVGRSAGRPHRGGGVGADGVPCQPRVLDGVGDRLGQHAERGQPVPGEPVVASERPGLRAGVEQHLAEVDGVDPVDECEMGLPEHRHPTLLESLDDVDLPQWPAAVQRPGHDPGHQLAQLVHAPRARQRRAAYVEAEVEVGVVDPRGRGHPARHPLQPAAVAGHERDPLPHQCEQPVVVEPRVAGIEDLDGRVVHRRRGRLVGQQRQVARAQPLAHRTPFHPVRGIVDGRGLRGGLVPRGILTEVGRLRLAARTTRGRSCDVPCWP